jgi:hypothetical protein
MDEIYPSTRSGSTLFKATNSTTSILEISGKGDFKIDKSIYPLHPLEDPGTVSTGVFPTAIKWSIFNPTVSLNGSPSTISFNVSRGLDFYLEPPTLGLSDWGICLWTPATGGAFGQNGGWLNLLEDSEFINFRVHSSNPDIGFRYIGINTTNVKNSAPSAGTARADLGSNGATTVEFTIMNISKTSSGNGGSNRWFKVLYQAWGKNLSPICGELYTNGATP